MPCQRNEWYAGLLNAVPGELLGEEPLDARPAHDLGELPVVAEDVRVPELAAAPAELALEERLPEQELPDERLAGRDVAVRLDPGAADGNELAARDALPDPLVEIGVALLDPGVLLRLRAGEPVLGIGVHVRGLRAERPDALAVRLGDRPEPGGIDVRVSDRDDLVAVVAVPLGVERRERRAGLAPALAILGPPHVAEAVQLIEEPPRERRVETPRVLGLELPQHLEVEEQVPRLLVEQRDVAAVEHDRLDRGVVPIEGPELPVARHLDLEPELLPGACASPGAWRPVARREIRS